MIKVVAARAIGALAFFIGGGELQVWFWRKPGEPYYDALGRHPYFGIFYFILASLVAEHTLKWMKHGDSIMNRWRNRFFVFLLALIAISVFAGPIAVSTSAAPAPAAQHGKRHPHRGHHRRHHHRR